MARSQNGWTATPQAYNYAPFKWVTGRLNKNADVLFLFDDFCEWYNREIEPITQAHSWGWAYREIRGSSTTLSNHASGTAIDLNAPKHALGKSGTFSNEQAAKIRAKLKEYGGAIRWGGDYSGRKDEMHFEINTGEAKLKQVADKIRAGAKNTPPAVTAPTTPAKNTPPAVTAPQTPAKKPAASVWGGITKTAAKDVQRALKTAGYYKGVLDGVYGELTKDAVRRYQGAQRFKAPKADGYWGKGTQSHYDWTLKLQQTLNAWKGTTIREDGDYGLATENKVREVQRRNLYGAYAKVGGELVDGHAGPITCKMLGIPAHP